ncbi:Pyridine nucleotide-disulfide oxidoreductase domain-containing protein 2 [Paramecium bursaria]
MFDAIIIGGGHNALVASNYLAQRFKKILVLEQRFQVGGAASTEELFPGFKFSRFSYLCSLLRPQIIKDLALFENGMKLHKRSISSMTVTKQKEYLLMNSDPKFNQEQIAKFSKADSLAFKDYNDFLSDIIDIWSRLQDNYPLDFSLNNKSLKYDQFYKAFKIAYEFKQLRYKYNDYFAFTQKSSSQFLNQWFESDLLKGTLITDGIIGEMIGVDTPASAYVLLHHVMGELFPNSKGEWAFVEGGMGKISQILQKVAEQRGVQIQCNSNVSEIIISEGQAKGVLLSDGTKLMSNLVISSCTPKVTFQKLIKESYHEIDQKYFQSIKHIEYNGACTKFNFAVSEVPKFTCFQNTEFENYLPGTLHLGCESVDQLRKGYLEVLNGASFSQNLFVDMVIPTMHDKTLAPNGQHIVQCLVQYTPYKAGWNQQKKQELTEYVIDFISSYAPNFKKSILFQDVLTPLDIENILGMTEGNIFHGSLTLDRLYANRPTNGYHSYGTPIKGLYLCGSGTHPGGGVMGAPGRNAAQFILSQS